MKLSELFPSYTNENGGVLPLANDDDTHPAHSGSPFAGILSFDCADTVADTARSANTSIVLFLIFIVFCI